MGDLQRMTTVNFAGLVLLSAATALIPLLLTPIPFDEIIAIAALLLAVVGVAGTVISNMRQVLVDNFDELVCELYNGESAAAAESAFEAKYQELIEAQAFDTLTEFTAINTMKHMLGGNAVNVLFERDTTHEYPEGDCSSCEPCGEVWTFDEEGNTEGWEATTTFPNCFGLGGAPLVTLGVSGGRICTLTRSLMAIIIRGYQAFNT